MGHRREGDARNWRSTILSLSGVGITLIFLFGVARRLFPLGVPGEWEWARIDVRPDPARLAVAGLLAVMYAIFVAVGARGLMRARSWLGEAAWLAPLLPAGLAVQAGLMVGAPEGYGLTKWVTLSLPGASGYHTVAREQIRDGRAFWRAFPAWIEGQDVLHVGTHPPGLFLLAHAARSTMLRHPGLARRIDESLPAPVVSGFRAIAPELSRPDRAALALTAAATWLASVGTAIPLYILARSRLGAPGSWFAATLWPVVPATVLFHPTADTAYPILVASALAAGVWSARVGGRRGYALAAIAGVLLALGMQLTLAFLAVGFVLALTLAWGRSLDWRLRFGRVAAVGAGFAAMTALLWGFSGADPLAIWRTNARNHAGFYAEYPRRFAAWVLVNPVELGVALGLPATVWAVAGLTSIRRLPGVTWATIGTLVLLTLSGRNLSEVARLWLPLMPPLLVGAASAFERFRAGPIALAFAILLTSVQILGLEAMLQVVYPT